jgi:hypothetical protein
MFSRGIEPIFIERNNRRRNRKIFKPQEMFAVFFVLPSPVVPLKAKLELVRQSLDENSIFFSPSDGLQVRD